jgi:hypothetical protein
MTLTTTRHEFERSLPKLTLILNTKRLTYSSQTAIALPMLSKCNFPEAGVHPEKL